MSSFEQHRPGAMALGCSAPRQFGALISGVEDAKTTIESDRGRAIRRLS
jgi:hypothetical protein